MPGRHTLAIWDYDREIGHVTVPTVVIDEINLVAQDAFMDAFVTAVGGVSLGVIYKDTRVFSAVQLAGTEPSDEDAQRELKWLVQMSDDVTFQAHTMEIPCADLQLLDALARGRMDETDAAYTALKAAIEDYYLTKAGNAVTVGHVILVGRNL